MNAALIGSVSSSRVVLEAMIRGGITVTAVLGADESQADATSDYRSLRRLARDADLPFYAFVKQSEPGVRKFLETHKPDLLWIIGLHPPVDASLIRLANVGCIGFQPTALPIDRGPDSIAWTILHDASSAATLFWYTHKGRPGEIITRRGLPVGAHDYAENLLDRANSTLSVLVRDLAPAVRTGQPLRAAGHRACATDDPQDSRTDMQIDWNQPTDQIYRLIRAVSRPYGGAYTVVDGRKVTIWRARPVERIADDDQPPGTVIRTGNGVFVRTGDGVIRVTEAQCGLDDDMKNVLATGARAGD